MEIFPFIGVLPVVWLPSKRPLKDVTHLNKNDTKNRCHDTFYYIRMDQNIGTMYLGKSTVDMVQILGELSPGPGTWYTFVFVLFSFYLRMKDVAIFPPSQ